MKQPSTDDIRLLDLLYNSDLTVTEAANVLNKSPIAIQQQLQKLRVLFGVRGNFGLVKSALESGYIGTNLPRKNATDLLATWVKAAVNESSKQTLEEIQNLLKSVESKYR